jgi:hypothetical protein
MADGIHDRRDFSAGGRLSQDSVTSVDRLMHIGFLSRAHAAELRRAHGQARAMSASKRQSESVRTLPSVTVNSYRARAS